MATNTPNIGLTKPATTEAYNVGVQNANMDKIDAAVDGLNKSVGLLDYTVTFSANWTAYTPAFGGGIKARLDRTNVMLMGGATTSASPTSGDVIATLPTQVRPKVTIIAIGMTAPGPVQVRILPDGSIQWFGGSVQNVGWLMFTGITYPTN